MRYLIIVVASLVLAGCGAGQRYSSNTAVQSAESYAPTDPESFVIYETKLQLQGEYKEIGTIKTNTVLQPDEVKRMAAARGAQAVYKDGVNFVMVRFIPVNYGY